MAHAMGQKMDAGEVLSGPGAGRIAQRAAAAAIGVALFLLVIKAIAGAVTGSVGLLGLIIDSALDASASLLNLLALREASLPADREHRFGHGKAEALAGLGQGLLIAGSALFLIVQSVRRFLEPVALVHSELGIAVIFVTLIATALLVLYQRQVIRRTGSLAIAADQLHYSSDIVLNLGVMLGLVLGASAPRVDAAVGFLVGLYVARGAFGILSVAADQLMDREFEEADRAKIAEIIARDPDVLRMHELRTRRAGFDRFIQLHIELDPAQSLARAHAISDRVEAEIKQVFPAAQVIIHEDPAGLEVPPREP
jgi:ferrous-iron efflux pump FieF